MPKLTYPQTAAVDQVDDYHGVKVADPYRWLEDPDSPEMAAWGKAQNKVTFGYLEGIATRAKIKERLTELWDFPKVNGVFKRGGRYFQLRNTGLQNQDVLYVMDALDANSRVLIDPNTLSEDGTVALVNWSVGKDGGKIAYATTSSGSDWLTWRVRDVDTGEDLPDRVEWSKFSDASWPDDGSGFFYSAYDPPEAGAEYTGAHYYHKVYFHKLGAPQAEDDLIYERPDQKEWGFDAGVTDDGRYLVIFVFQGTDTRNGIFYKDLETGGDFVELLQPLEAAFNPVGNDGPVFYFVTDLDAPRGRLVAIDTRNPGPDHWRTLVPEGEDKLESVTIVHDQFVALYLHDAHSQIRRFDKAGDLLGEVELPALGSVQALSGRPDHDEMFYIFTSFVYPGTAYRYDFKTGGSEAIAAPPRKFDPDEYITEQLFAAGKDGARVPMFVTHKKGLAKNGDNPALLYGYGGFNISITPSFSAMWLAWLEMGGVLAVANLRGGGEYGEEWHQAGMIHNKQNVFDDFIACAEHLIAAKYTAPSRLAIQGGSNGGLLVGACITQRPDLFGAALPSRGVMDMLRFHKFTIGWAWVSDYGSSDDPRQFESLYAYSPLHNIKPGVHYPATLVTTADHDDRVVPGHSFKFAAALQAAQAGDAPVLIRIEMKAGHGMGTPTSKRIEEASDNLAFLAAALKML
ncbi:MAG: S9 family peptidase [Anaerolineae bacterium]|nr:S9 family peptidase [Anaerolineae bacterium]